MDVLLSSAASPDATSTATRRLADAGHQVSEHRDPSQSDAVVAFVSRQLDAERLVGLMETLMEARRHDVRVVAMTDSPPDKHPAAIRALGLGDSWVRLDHGSEDEIASQVQSLSPAVSALVAACDSADDTQQPLVFLSYSSRDERHAGSIIAELRHRGIGVWVDRDSIAGGERWRASIERGIRRCDVVVVLLSNNVTDHPHWVESELGLAQSAAKRIIPVQLNTMSPLPEGFGLMLSGTQMIKLYPNYRDGIAKLVAAIGAEGAAQATGGLVARLRRRGADARRFAEQHNVVSKAAFVGAAVLATAGAVAAVYAKADREREAAAAAELTAQQVAARREYAQRTDRLLAKGIRELADAPTMVPSEYRREVKPRMMHTLGSLESGRPTSADSAFVARHDRLVDDLNHLVAEFDKYFDKLERGEADGIEHTVRRLSEAWAATWESGQQWVKESYEAADVEPEPANQP